MALFIPCIQKLQSSRVLGASQAGFFFIQQIGLQIFSPFWSSNMADIVTSLQDIYSHCYSE